MKSKKIKTKKLQEQRKRLKTVFFESALVIVTTAIIVWFIPRHSVFNYTYELHQPWRYGALLSTQKYNVQMSDSAIIHQRDSISRIFMPYFNKDAATKTKVCQAMSSMADKAQVSAATKWRLMAALDTVFQYGIMESRQMDSLVNNGIHTIRVVSNNMATPVKVKMLYTPKTAYSFILKFAKTDADFDLSAINLNHIITEDLFFDKSKSQSEYEEQIGSLSSSVGFVSANEKIVDRGDIVTEEVYQKLKSYQQVLEENDQSTDKPLISLDIVGQAMIVLIILTMLVVFLSMYRKDYLEHKRNSVLLFSLVTLFFIAAALMVSHHFFHIFILPCCMLPIIIRTFLDSRTAFTFHIATVILISLILNSPYEFILLQVVAGWVAIFDLRELTQRSQIIHAALAVSLLYILFYCAYQLATNTEIKDIEVRNLIYFAINGGLLLFTYPLLWMIEKMFGFVSDVTLVELSNINHPLLRQLSEEAPGTFQHSMQVANLASDVAKRIGAKVQLVRTGALYHDIGKTDRPVFFTENQNGASPHKHMSCTKSAEVIIAHVHKGLALADKYNLPQAIKDFIATHHGVGKTKYFLITYQNEHPDEEVDESLFTYPGPNPKTKEEAILMMSDAVEASSRSLPEYTEEGINSLVDKIVDSMVAEGFFRECPLTFQDINDSKDVFKNRLMNIYHTRISYPELQRNS